MAPAASPRVRSSGMPPASRMLLLLATGSSLALAVVQVGHDGDEAVVRELAGHLLAGFIPAGHVVEQVDGRERSRAQGRAR